VTGEQISPSLLPDFAREHITEEQEMGNSIAEIADLVDHLRDAGESQAKLGLPGGADLVAIMNAQRSGEYSRIERIYKQVSVVALAGILHAVRTKLVELTAEIRVATGGAEVPPSAEAVDQAVSVVVYGRKPSVVITQATGQNITQQAAGRRATTSAGSTEDRWTHSLGFWLTVVGTVVSAVIGVLIWMR
jgi:hypothetical protein